MGSSNQTTIDQLQRVVNKILFLKKKSVFTFRGVRFFPSEVHLMLVIKDQRSSNATRMADALGVTKGAVSQTLTRLKKKGVLTKERDPRNKNELTLSFTSFGRQACDFYEQQAAELFKKHDRYLRGYSSAEKDVIQRFLAEVERVFDDIDE